MIIVDEDALVCDLAETYGIYDYRSLPIDLVATFSIGLRDDSRIKLKLSGSKQSLETMLLASAVDRLSMLVWAKSRDGQRNRNKPKSIVEELTNGGERNDNIRVFSTPEEFDSYRARFVKGGA